MLGTPPYEDADGPKRLLGRIAETLALPPETFFDPLSCELGQAVELIRLWHAIRNDRDREKVMAMARMLAARV